MTKLYPPLANIFLRAIASLIDCLIVILPHSWFITLLAQSNSVPNLVNLSLLYLGFILTPWINYLYSIFMILRFQATIGKLLTGIQITNIDYQPLTFGKIFLRQTIGYLFSNSLFGFGYLAMINHPKQQTWHDQAFGSLVIVKRPIWPIGILALIGLVIANALLLISAYNHFSTNANLKFDLYNYYQSFKASQASIYDNHDQTISPQFKIDYQSISGQIHQNQLQTASQSANLLKSSAQNRHEAGLALHLQAQIAFKQQDFSQALSLMQQAIGLEDENPLFHYNLGLILNSLGETDRANESFQKAVQLDPENQDFQSALKSAK